MTALDDWQVQLGDSGLLLGPGTVYGVKTIDGLDRAIRERDTDRANADGAVMGPDYAEPKLITVEIMVEGGTAAAAMENYDALAAAWNSARGSEGAQSTVTLRFRLPGRVAQRLEGGRPRRIAPNLSDLELGFIRAVATYYAPDPRVLSDALHTVNLDYGDTATVIDNDGNHPAAVVWDVHGVVTNPGVIRNEAARFDLTTTVASGTYHRVRTDARRVTRSSDAAEVYAEISGTPAEAFWLEIPAGGGSFRAVGSGYGAAQVVATYRDTWL